MPCWHVLVWPGCELYLPLPGVSCWLYVPDEWTGALRLWQSFKHEHLPRWLLLRVWDWNQRYHWIVDKLNCFSQGPSALRGGLQVSWRKFTARALPTWNVPGRARPRYMQRLSSRLLLRRPGRHNIRIVPCRLLLPRQDRARSAASLPRRHLWQCHHVRAGVELHELPCKLLLRALGHSRGHQEDPRWLLQPPGGIDEAWTQCR